MATKLGNTARVLGMSIVALSATSAFAPGISAADPELTVVVDVVRGIGTFDHREGSSAGGPEKDPDFYSVVTIDGARHKSLTVRNRVRSNPAWRFTKSVTRRTVPIVVELREEDYRGARLVGQDATPSTRVDINPRAGKRRLRLNLDTHDCRLTGESNRVIPAVLTDNGCGFRFKKTGNNPRKGAEVVMSVTFRR